MRKKVLTFDNLKLYLDSCATYNNNFVDWYLENIHKVKLQKNGHCNTWVITTNKKWYYGPWEMHNRNGVSNLLSILQPEKLGYNVKTGTDENWVVITPNGKGLVFKRDIDFTAQMPSIDLCE